MQQYFDKNDLMSPGNFSNQPFIFSTSENPSLSIENFSSGKITVLTKADKATHLVFQQNFYPHWYYYDGTEKREVMHAGINFMSAPISKDEQHITFSFEPIFIKWMMLLSAASFLVCLSFVLILKTKPAANP